MKMEIENWIKTRTFLKALPFLAVPNFPLIVVTGLNDDSTKAGKLPAMKPVEHIMISSTERDGILARSLIANSFPES